MNWSIYLHLPFPQLSSFLEDFVNVISDLHSECNIFQIIAAEIVGEGNGCLDSNLFQNYL